MDSSITYRHLDTPDDWTRAFDVMKELRPHLTDANAFCAQMRRQREESYRLLAACDEDGAILGLAGYRTQTNTLYGRFVYVDDLVVTSRLQRGGIGAGLLDRVREIARHSRCAHFVLDTGLHMALAQRFYYRNGLLAKGMHFVEPLAQHGENAS
ncbi:N-acetyltransferase GCN5 (plasmid) [Burkholderia sp. SFA1]|uniref:GNAT family N-acetyltransferase n=1 Tax=unclassified Caballeronia TaxID=2646786 RepID=UPI001F1B48CC|nr:MULTISPECIES: GNAT family N-acetyltransferase [unclassified Caballeronia]MCE4546551.1 GNAT family N-acetyltransferase [Caballeronia sp. PC1]MCE4572976.1 GNAT family N-acetyltransferase [Caballeronia sp. CLC5]BBQ01648.1 N-acetyltransferase GCN5 [Burkholderia sp. SFA1]